MGPILPSWCLVVWAQVSPLGEIMPLCKLFPHMSKMPILPYSLANSVIIKNAVIFNIMHTTEGTACFFFTLPTIYRGRVFFNPQRGIACFPSRNTIHSGNSRHVVDFRGNPSRKTSTWHRSCSTSLVLLHQAQVNLAYFDYHIKSLWFSCSLRLLNYLTFQSFDIERTRWRLFPGTSHVH